MGKECEAGNAANAGGVANAGNAANAGGVGNAANVANAADAAGVAAGLDALAGMSNEYGRQARYVLAGGGNTSFKTEAELYVKASGTSLATVRAGDFVGLSRAKLDAIMEKPYDRADEAKREAEVLSDMMAARLAGSEGKRPSVETLLHNIFPERYVLHLHPALVNGLTCGAGGEEAARRLMPAPYVWIPAYRPGYELALLCRDRLGAYERERGERPKVILLQNHGIFVSGDAPQEIGATLGGVMGALDGAAAARPACRPPEAEAAGAGVKAGAKVGAGTGAGVDAAHVAGADPAPAVAADPAAAAAMRLLAGIFPPPAAVRFSAGADILRLLESERSFFPLSGPFTPDHIVYCKPSFLYIGELGGEEGLRERIGLFEREHGYAPRVICVRGVGAFFAGASETEAANAQLLFGDAADIAVYSQNFGGPSHMPRELADFILGWEIESYRQKVAAGGGAG
ncbi:MAG: class II aldolase/adducin family protein [Clostridiales bacterium]|jgi:rhamnose utilization protein RhaD (predicted bifunctional aldolase and dehydrogenase)|nr:class II aldolase/adducin family protein [Clostridiales bacterium]